MPSQTEFVETAIKKDDVVIFSKNGCPFCKKAKTAFDKLNQKYHAIEVDELDECQEIQDALEEKTGARTVPRVFIKGNFIGGGSDVEKMFHSGELKKKLGL